MLWSTRLAALPIFAKMKRLELLPTADMHVHLRQAKLMELVVPTVEQGGVDTVFVYGLLNRQTPSRVIRV